MRTPDTIRPMRRAIVIFMLSLLSSQFVWGAAAGYCQHEQGAAIGHFGHHDHKHQGKVNKTAAATTPDGTAGVGDEDPDCASCHLSCVSPVTHGIARPASDPGKALPAAPGSAHPARIPCVIERPNWALAA